MLAFAGIRIFKAGCAVKAIQPELVFRKMRRHPVEYHADAVLMHNIYKFLEFIRGAVA